MVTRIFNKLPIFIFFIKKDNFLCYNVRIDIVNCLFFGGLNIMFNLRRQTFYTVAVSSSCTCALCLTAVPVNAERNANVSPAKSLNSGIQSNKVLSLVKSCFHLIITGNLASLDDIEKIIKDFLFEPNDSATIFPPEDNTVYLRILGKYFLAGFYVYLFTLFSTRFLAKNKLKRRIKKIEESIKRLNDKEGDLKKQLIDKTLNSHEEKEKIKLKIEEIINKTKRMIDLKARTEKAQEELGQKLYYTGIPILVENA